MINIKRLLLIVFFLLPLADAKAVGLKENSIIEGDTITLGDVFYDLPRDEDRVLGVAPRPGQEMVLNARTLLRIAMALDLPWRPTDSTDQVVLSRDATIIEYEQIEEALHTALYDEGVFGEYEITIPAQYHRIILPKDEPSSLVVTKFSADQSKNIFEARIAAPSADNPIHNFYIKGSMASVITVPVLTDNLQSGQIINPSDITYIKIKERDFGKDTIVDADVLTGMTARRVVMAGRPIKKIDLVSPQIVERGKLVTLSLNNGILNLTTQVKALQNGSKGDVIRVVNTTSNQTLQAQVIGENQVTVVQN